MEGGIKTGQAFKLGFVVMLGMAAAEATIKGGTWLVNKAVSALKKKSTPAPEATTETKKEE